MDNKTVGYALTGFSVVLLVILIIIKMDVDAQSAFLCEKFHENQLNMEECPAHTSNMSWLITGAFAISIIILGSGIYLLMIKPAPEQKEHEESSHKEFKPVDIAKLDDDEKHIYELIKNKSGSAYQGDVVKETSFGKVRVSRILDKLETKGILERKRRGMTNIVVLK